MTRSRSLLFAGLCLSVLIAFGLRALSLDTQSLWRDEVDALRFAQEPWRRLLSNFTRHGWNGPFYFVLLRLWVRVAGTTETALRFLSLFFGVFGVPLAFVLGCRLVDRTTGTVAAFLIATSPYMTWYGQEVKMYTFVTALALLALYSLRRALDGDGWIWWAVQIGATSLAFYTHILAALLVPVQCALALIWWRRTRKQWGGAVVSLCLLTLPYLPLAHWQVPLVFQTRDTGFTKYTLEEMVSILLDVWSTGMTAQGGMWPLLLSGLLALIGLVKLTLVTRERRSAIALLAWAAIPLLAIWAISTRQPLFTARYLIWTAPAFFLAIASGLTGLAGRGKLGRGLAVSLAAGLLLINGLNLHRQATVPLKSDFRGAAAYIAAYEEPQAEGSAQTAERSLSPSERRGQYTSFLPLVVNGHRGSFDALILFQIPYARYTFDYYFPIEEYPWADGLYTNHRSPGGDYLMSEAEAGWRMREMTEGYDTVWLLASEWAMWDERGLVKGWLDRTWRLVDAAEFKYVSVYRYERK